MNHLSDAQQALIQEALATVKDRMKEADEEYGQQYETKEERMEAMREILLNHLACLCDEMSEAAGAMELPE